LSGFADEIIAVEDYLLVPRIIGRAMKVPALITVVAVPIGVRCSG
jgi:predicted PurR-regulated permease PerM